jgi:cyclopropane-fatty-acyl-phospholipid synthase
LGRFGSRRRTQAAITYHYDLPPEFFELWLDRQMVYSCAYFESPFDDLDTAQLQKLDYVCRKLDLVRGERLMDWGCGWGALVIHAARNYGVDATGLTLSRMQADYANERIEREGLAGRCRVRVMDVRDCPDSEPYDKLVSVGMVEHVPESRLKAYFGRALRVLKPGGLFLNHGITHSYDYRLRGAQSFMERYIFPDSALATLHASLTAAETAGLEVRDVENLREHYALTLRHWVRRLEAQHAAAAGLTDEPTYRRFRVYLAGSAYNFDTGRLHIFQTLLCKPTGSPSGLALTRRRWYTRAAPTRQPQLASLTG